MVANSLKGYSSGYRHGNLNYLRPLKEAYTVLKITRESALYWMYQNESKYQESIT